MSVAAVQSFYGRWARLYDLLATAPGVTAWRRRAVDALDLKPGDTVVEMGCGTGANLPYLRQAVGPEGTVVGLDLAPGVLARARDRIVDRGWRNVHVALADATRPPVGGPVDAVLGTFVVGMFADPATAVADWLDRCTGRVALLNFQRSDAPLAAPLNLAFEAFVWAASPGRGVPAESPAAALERRVAAARGTLTARTADRRFETFAGGYLGLLSGRVAGR
jgi:ubiquinone/menaquinone biosynthesis C-methylase UbiE